MFIDIQNLVNDKELVEEYKNTMGKLPDDIILLEKEVWQAIQDVITLNNQMLSLLVTE